MYDSQSHKVALIMQLFTERSKCVDWSLKEMYAFSGSDLYFVVFGWDSGFAKWVL